MPTTDSSVSARLSEFERRLEATEKRAREAEDRLAVLNLVAFNAYLADASFADAAQIATAPNHFTPDGVMNFLPEEMEEETIKDSPDYDSLALGQDPYVAGSAVEVRMAEAGEILRSALPEAGRRETSLRGITHYPSLPYVTLKGDTAVAINYLQVLERDPSAPLAAIPPHGTRRGFRPFMVVVNIFHCERTVRGWRIKRRILRTMGTKASVRMFKAWAAER
jgi:hypothetical protein